MKSALSRGLPLCSEQPARADMLAIVGAGPSVRDYLDELRRWPGVIWAINGAYNYLQDNGIIPDGFLGVDPLPGLADYVKRPNKKTRFYISGYCHPDVFDALEGHDIHLFFPEQDGVKFPPGTYTKVGGGTTAITRAPFLGRLLGYRDFTIFGADSSFLGDRYVYGEGKYIEDSKAPINRVMCNGEGPFLTELCLMKQVSQLGVISMYFGNDRIKSTIEIKCGGLMDAYLRSPVETEDGVYSG